MERTLTQFKYINIKNKMTEISFSKVGSVGLAVISFIKLVEGTFIGGIAVSCND